MFKKWHSLGVGFLAVLFVIGVFPTSTADSATNRILPMLKISLTTPGTQKISQVRGTAFVVSEKLSGDVHAISFRLFDKNFAEVWAETWDWRDAFSQGKQVIVPFSFDFSTQKFSGDLNFKISLLDRENVVLAQNRQKILFPVAEKSVVRFSEISNLTLDTSDEKSTAQFSFFNRGEFGDFQGEISVYESSPDRPKIFFARSDFQNIDHGGEQEFSVSFDRPARPQVYEVEARVAKKMGEAVTGVLKKTFLVDGAFGEIHRAGVSAEKFWRAGETATLQFSGALVPMTEDPLDVSFSIWSEENGEKFEQISESYQIYSDRKSGDFSDEKEVTILHETGKLLGKISIARGEIVLGERNFETIESEKWVRNEGQSTVSFEIEKAVGEFSEASLEQKIALLAGAIGFLLIIFLGIIFARRSRKTLVLILVVAIGSFGAQVHAEWNSEVWENSVQELRAAYNPQKLDSISAGFRTIQIRGALLHQNLEGPFQSEILNDGGATILATLKFFREDAPEGESPVYEISVSPDSFQVLEGETLDSEFQVSVELPGDLERMNDGEYAVQLTFSVPQSGEAFKPWVIQNDLLNENEEIPLLLGSVLLDQSPPDLSFWFGAKSGEMLLEDFESAQNVWAVPECGDAGSGCVIQPNAFQIFENYCEDSAACSSGIRQFEICDWVGNCATTTATEFQMTAIDKSPPEISAISLKGFDDDDESVDRTISTSSGEATMKAVSQYILSLVATDSGGTIDPPSSVPACENSDDFNLISGVCAAPAPCMTEDFSLGFYSESGKCVEGECPSGYKLETNLNGNSICILIPTPTSCSTSFSLSFPFCFETAETCSTSFPLGFEFCFE